MDGIQAGFSEEWVRSMFEEYTRQVILGPINIYVDYFI